jgi:5-methylcytosine-specific restriction endonuclease McrA
MNERTKVRVRERAKNRCEYCQLTQEDSPLAALHIEHIIPKIHGGTNDLDNLALACIDCNLHKGPNLTGIDPQTKRVTPLFHPRKDNWNAHFKWRSIYVMGKTAMGRTTIRVLHMNSEEQLSLRSS